MEGKLGLTDDWREVERVRTWVAAALVDGWKRKMTVGPDFARIALPGSGITVEMEARETVVLSRKYVARLAGDCHGRAFALPRTYDREAVLRAPSERRVTVVASAW